MLAGIRRVAVDVDGDAEPARALQVDLQRTQLVDDGQMLHARAGVRDAVALEEVGRTRRESRRRRAWAFRARHEQQVGPHEIDEDGSEAVDDELPARQLHARTVPANAV